MASVIIWHPTPPSVTFWAYAFALELFLVGLLMVSTLRFPSFKKKANTPKTSMVTSLSIVLVFAMMILLQQQFFIAFFTTYVLLALALNLAWKAGWHGITPPHDAAEEPEAVN